MAAVLEIEEREITPYGLTLTASKHAGRLDSLYRSSARVCAIRLDAVGMAQALLRPPMISAQSAPKEPPPAALTRVLLVDDHPTFRQGLTFLLNETNGEFEVCGEAENASEAIEAFRSLHPDLVVLDVSMPGTSGIELIKMILAESAATPILVLTVHEETVYAIRALKIGAKGYVMKSEAMESVAVALRTIAAGKHYVSPRLQKWLMFHAIESSEGLGSPVDVLADRELEVLELLGRGFGTRAMADYLHLSTKTIETHRAHIKQKLGFKDVTEMVQFANDWVSHERNRPLLAT